MTRLFLLVFFCLPFLCQAQSVTQQAWKWQNPNPQVNDLTDLTAVDGQYLWAVGTVGTIIHSADSGKTWTQQKTPVSTWLRKVFFINNQIGWATGELGTILKTTNGGQTWSQQSSPNNTHYFNDVYFLDAQNGWIAGTFYNNALILQTSNGGETWTENVSNLPGGLMGLTFTNPSTCWAVGFSADTNYILKTTNGGQNWTNVSQPLFQGAFRVQFTDAQQGFISHQFGGILRTTNGGLNWETQTGPTGFFAGSHFLNGQGGALVGGQGALFLTTNAGTSWSQQSVPTTAGLTGVHMLSPQTIVAVGDTGVILRSTNGGQTWQNLVPSPGFNLHASHFFDAQNGVAVGSRGRFLRTTNGGQNWQTTLIDTSASLNDIFFTSPQTGWIAASRQSDGIFYKTTDAGASWTGVVFGPVSAPGFNAVHFIDSLSGWMVGKLGYIMGTTNGGQNWSPQSSFFQQELFDVHFTDALNGFVVGESGISLRTSDGGNMWLPANAQATAQVTLESRFEKVHFLNANLGWAAGAGFQSSGSSGGLITHTSDGGASWTVQYNGPVQVRSIQFLNAQTGWAVGDSGQVLYTSNGGSSWTAARRSTFRRLNAVSVLDTNRIWAFGAQGSILFSDFPSITRISDETQAQSPELQIFPNPAQNKLHLHSSQLLSRMQVSDVLGKIYPATLLLDSSLDLSTLLPGLYILQAETSRGPITLKFLKQP
jgi:photosystem II stability/assembly factor-like uncharacterized protein